jgi:hypothetical protein
MDTPEGKSQGQDAAEQGAEETVPDLEATGEDATDQVTGAGQRVRGTVKWIDEAALPEQQ